MKSVTVHDLLRDVVFVPTERQGQIELNRVARILRSLGWERYQERSGGQRQWRYRRAAKAAPLVAKPGYDDLMARAGRFIAYAMEVEARRLLGIRHRLVVVMGCPAVTPKTAAPQAHLHCHH